MQEYDKDWKMQNSLKNISDLYDYEDGDHHFFVKSFGLWFSVERHCCNIEFYNNNDSNIEFDDQYNDDWPGVPFEYEPTKWTLAYHVQRESMKQDHELWLQKWDEKKGSIEKHLQIC